MSSEELQQKSAEFWAYLKLADCRLTSVGVALLVAWIFVFICGLTRFGVSVDQANWFGRSGAVLTIASLLSTIRLAGLKEALRGEGGFGSQHGIDAFREREAIVKFSVFAGNASAVVGTAIWGYGDLFHCFLFGVGNS